MLYAKIVGGTVEQYPYGIDHLKADNPQVGFPVGFLGNSSASEYNVFPVSEIEKPVKAGYRYEQGSVESDGSGGWRQSWVEVAKTKEELADSDITPVPMPSIEERKNIGTTMTEGDPAWDGEKWVQTWVEGPVSYISQRLADYGEAEVQIEFITENGLEAWQAKVAEIKAKYPKS